MGSAAITDEAASPSPAPRTAVADAAAARSTVGPTGEGVQGTCRAGPSSCPAIASRGLTPSTDGATFINPSHPRDDHESS